MRVSIYSSLFFTAVMFFLVSCDTGTRNTRQQSVGPSTLNLLPPLPGNAPVMAANRPAVADRPIVPGSIATPISGNVKLNPAHGQPGHRCEIPVGSPLPGAVSAPSLTSVINSSAAPSAIPVQSNAKPNPKHGEPGHRCDIPVGAPLDSPPGKVAPATAANNNSNGKLNPKHGEPGHRCDIPVGAPLNSPPGNTASTAPANSVPVQKSADSTSGPKQ